MARLSSWLPVCFVAIYVIAVVALVVELAAPGRPSHSVKVRSCDQDGICKEFSEELTREEAIMARTMLQPPLSPLEALAKALSQQRQFGPEITPQHILELLETVREERRKRETL